MPTEADVEYEDLEQDEDDGRRRRALPWIILFIIFAIVLWLIWHYGGWRDDTGGKVAVSEVKKLVSVPDLIGVGGQDAERLLERLGLVPEVIVSYDTVGDPGSVSDQSPGSGVQVRQGATVKIWVIDSAYGASSEDETREADYAGEAKGSTARTRTVRTAIVPDVVGLSESSAIDRLAAAGFVGRPMYQPRSWGDYRVFEQQPKAGEVVEEGFQVHFLIMVPE